MSVEKTSVVISLIIPAYNEERRIGKSLEQIFQFCNAQALPYEIIVVDDGSVDGTVPLIRERFGGHSQLRITRQPARAGKGAALQRGMLEGRGDYIFFTDADLSVPIATLPALLTELRQGFDIAIGSRRAPGAKIEVHQPFLRESMGRVFTLLSNRVLGMRYRDVTCGFKGFRSEAARELFSRQRLHNWSFDSEILFIARLKGYRVAEIPVSWRNDEGTKVRLWKDVATSFLGLLQIRVNQVMGRYC
jgi:dolichyl-phosphate beta-glucosyltransferase